MRLTPSLPASRLLVSLASIQAAENRSEDDDKSRTHLRADAKRKRGSAFEDPYTDIYRAAVERRMQAAATRRNQTRKNVQEDISTACAAWMLAARGGEARYRDVAFELYDRDAGNGIVEITFFCKI